jgi:hypothetical protein
MSQAEASINLAATVDIPLEEVRATTAKLMQIHNRAQTPFGTYVLRGDDPLSSVPRFIEGRVLDEAFGNDAAVMEAEYGAYEDASLFVCVVDHRRSLPVGAARIILPSPAGFKSLDDIERIYGELASDVLTRTGLVLNDGETWDIATLTVDQSYRDGLISLALYQGICTLAAEAAIRWFVAIVDVKVLRMMQYRIARPFERYAGIEPKPYLDSPASLAVWCTLSEWRERMRTKDTVLEATVFGGIGLEDAVSHPAWSEFSCRQDSWPLER